MTIHDDEIRAAYEQLGAQLAPPMDAVSRVEGRVRTRRRRRRALMTGAGSLTALAVVGSVLVLASGDDPDGNQAATDPTGEGSTLVLTRPDGSTYAFDDVTVSCQPPEAYGEAAVDEPGHIYMFSPIEISGSLDDDARAVQPFVTFDGIVDKIQGDRTFTFPNDWEMPSDEYPLVLFMADTDGNEVASSAGGESGTVHVLEASCSPTPVLQLEIDMTLGSEVHKDSLRLTGGLR